MKKGHDSFGNVWRYEDDVAEEKLQNMNPDELLNAMHRQYRTMMKQAAKHPEKEYEANGMWQAIQIIESLMGDENQ